MSRYLGILRRRAALVPFAAAVVARLPISMAPLGMVLLVQSDRGTYALAGLVSGAFALGAAVSAPLWGRTMDRRGQSLVIGPLAVASGALTAALALAVVRGAPAGALIGIAVGVGLAFPPVSPAMRASWRAVLADDADRRAAYALDAVAMESIFVGGPLLLSLLLAVAAPEVPLLVTGGLLAGGGVAYALTAAARRSRPDHSRPERNGTGIIGTGAVDAAADGVAPPASRGSSPLSVPAVLLTVLLATGVAIGFGLSDVSVAAAAQQVLGSQSRVGLLFAAIAGGSATGGLWYGSRHWRRPEHLRLPVSLGTFAVGLAAVGSLLASGRPSLLLLLPVLFVAGLAVAPSLIVMANLVDQHAPDDRLGEAQSWLNTAYTAGGAVGTAVAGIVVDAAGPARGFLCAAAAIATTTLLSATFGRVGRSPVTRRVSLRTAGRR